MSQAIEVSGPVLPSATAPASETANQVTHALGLGLSLLGAAVLMSTAVSSGDPYRITGCGVYALTLVALYAASTLSHSFADTGRRTFYRMLDQVCIFLLVVGTYTPFGLVHARHGAWSLVLIGMWLYALVGIGIRVRRPGETLRPLFFLMMGWLPVPILFRAYEVGQSTGLVMILAGGMAYTGGLWFLVNDHKHPYYHAVWHLCTIAGSLLHFLFVLQYVAPPGA
jgi:hemolysin III